MTQPCKPIQGNEVLIACWQGLEWPDAERSYLPGKLCLEAAGGSKGGNEEGPGQHGRG